MNTLTIFYDSNCGLCRCFREWLERQALWVSVEFIGFQTPDAARRFPNIEKMKADRECLVLADDGRWWQGKDAWIVCLWATREFRIWSIRLASPMFRPLIGNIVHMISSNRLTLSRLMGLRSDQALAEELKQYRPACEAGNCGLRPHLKEANNPNKAWK